MALLIKTDGSTQFVSPKNGTDFQLAELYALIGCDMVQALPMADGKTMWIDEEGKLKDNAQPNPTAEVLLKSSLAKIGLSMLEGDYLVGNALVCEEDEVL